MITSWTTSQNWKKQRKKGKKKKKKRKILLKILLKNKKNKIKHTLSTIEAMYGNGFCQAEIIRPLLSVWKSL